MKRATLFVVLGCFILSSCVPVAEQRPVDTAPITYRGTQSEVYDVVLRAVASSPGVPSYNPGGLDGYERGPSEPWAVTSSDPVSGVISAQAESRASGFLGSNAEPDVHEITVTLSSVGAAQTRVAARGTPQARDLADAIYALLNEEFERLE